MSTSRRVRGAYWEVTTLVTFAIASICLLSKEVKVALIIILLLDLFTTSYVPTIWHFIYLRVLEPIFATNLSITEGTLGAITSSSQDVSDWVGRGRQTGNIFPGVAATMGDIASRTQDATSNFIVTHTVWRRIFYQWSPTFRTPVIGWAIVIYAVHYFLANGFTLWGATISATILMFAIIGQSLLLTISSSMLSAFFSIIEGYKRYAERLSRFKAGSDESTQEEQQIFDPKKHTTSNWNEEAPSLSRTRDQTTHQPVTEIMTRPSLIEVFLPLIPLTYSASTTQYTASLPSESNPSDMEETAEEFEAKLGYKERNEGSNNSRQKFRNDESISTSGLLNSAASKYRSTTTSTAAPKVEEIPSERPPQTATQISFGFWSSVFGTTVGSGSRLSESLESVLTTTQRPQLATKKTKNKIISEFHEVRDSVESVAHKGQKSLHSFADEVLSTASTRESLVIEKLLSDPDVEKMRIIRTTEKTISALDKAKPEKSKSFEKASTATDQQKAETNKFAAKISTAAENANSKRTKIVDNILTSIQGTRALVEGFLSDGESESTEEHTSDTTGSKLASETTIKTTESNQLLANEVAQSAAEEMKDETSKVTRTVFAKATEYPSTIDEKNDNEYETHGIPLYDGSVGIEIGNAIGNAFETIGSIVANGLFGIFTNSIPKTLEFSEDLLEEYEEAPQLSAAHCVSCGMNTVFIYACGLLIAALLTPYLRVFFFRTKHQPYSPLAAAFAFMLWTPILFAFVGSVSYNQHFLIVEMVDFFYANPYLLLFTILFSLKILKTLTNVFSSYVLGHGYLPASKTKIAPHHVTVIIPYRWTTASTSDQYRKCIESILRQNPYQVILLTHSLAASLSAETFISYYQNWSFSIVMCQTGDELTHLLEAASKVRSPITILVKVGSITWGPVFLSAAIASFEDPSVALVAPSIYPYLAPPESLKQTPPQTQLQPSQKTQTSSTPPQPVSKSFLITLLKSKYATYNFTNTATYNLDGGVSPLSQNCLIIRTDLLHTPHFQSYYLRSNPGDASAALTTYVQSIGLKTIFLNSQETIVHLALSLRGATYTSLTNYAFGNLLASKRQKYRYILTSLILQRHTYARYPWTTFSGLISPLLVEMPFLLDVVMPYALWKAGGGAYICQFIVTMGVMRGLERLGGVKMLGVGEFLKWFWVLWVWEVVVEGVVGGWAGLTFWL